MQRSAKSDRFLAALRGHSRAIVFTHDNPDPDAIGSGWALHRLIEEKLRMPVRLVAGGAIVRAENRRMIQLLKPPIELRDQVHVSPQTALVFVDCWPGAAKHLLDDVHHPVAAVIDHHPRPKNEVHALYKDIRPNVVAAGTIATHYLREQQLEPDLALATALVYAIQTDARSATAAPSRTDKMALSWLVPRADLKKLAAIANAPLEPSYFLDLAMALDNTTLYGNTAICFLPTAHGPEVVGEFADLLVRCKCIARIFCAAVYNDDLIVSVRTTQEGGDASALVRRTLAGLGSGGGHQHRAGGKVPGPIDDRRLTSDLRSELCRRWLEACGVEATLACPLIPKELELTAPGSSFHNTRE